MSKIRRSRRHFLGPSLIAFAQIRGIGSLLTFTFLAFMGLTGAIYGGSWAVFVETYGTPQDLFARLLGLRISSLTVEGTHDLTREEIIQVGHLTPEKSLIFLDIEDLRHRLLQLPLVQDVSIHKFYPNHLLIQIVERTPFALWQKEGQVTVVAHDGTPLHAFQEERFSTLPFVVGEGAQLHLDEFMELLEASGEFKSLIRAGMYVGERRWTLKLTSGLEVKLPEINPQEALQTFVTLMKSNVLTDKDILSLDLRFPKQVLVHLSEEAMTTHLDLIAHKKSKGGPG